MIVVCGFCGCTVVIDREVPGACALCGRRAWQAGEPRAGRYEASACDQRYLKAIGIAWASREDG